MRYATQRQFILAYIHRFKLLNRRIAKLDVSPSGLLDKLGVVLSHKTPLALDNNCARASNVVTVEKVLLNKRVFVCKSRVGVVIRHRNAGGIATTGGDVNIGTVRQIRSNGIHLEGMLSHIEQNVLANPLLQGGGVHLIVGVLGFDIARGIENNGTRESQLIDRTFSASIPTNPLVRLKLRQLPRVLKRAGHFVHHLQHCRNRKRAPVL